MEKVFKMFDDLFYKTYLLYFYKSSYSDELINSDPIIIEEILCFIEKQLPVNSLYFSVPSSNINSAKIVGTVKNAVRLRIYMEIINE